MEQGRPNGGRLESRAIGGAAWTVLAFACSKFTIVATYVALANILSPADFGVVVLATLILGALTIFSDLGLAGTLVVKRDLDDRGKGTILTILLGAGAALAVLAAGAAPLLAKLFDEPRLDIVLAVLSITLVLGGLIRFYEALLQRRLEFKK